MAKDIADSPTPASQKFLSYRHSQPAARPKSSYVGNGLDLGSVFFYRGFDSGFQRHLVYAAIRAGALQTDRDVFVLLDPDECDVAAVAVEERPDFFERSFYGLRKFCCVHLLKLKIWNNGIMEILPCVPYQILY